MKKLLTAMAVAAGLVFATAPGAQAVASETELQSSILKKFNAARATKCGSATSLKLSDGLRASADQHAESEATYNYYAYDTLLPFYERWPARISRISGFNNVVSEVIDLNPGQVEDFVARSLAAGSADRQNVMNCTLKVMGFGYSFRGPTGSFWVVDFSDKIVNVGF